MWGFFYYFYIMNYTEKFFCNRDPDDTEILLIRNLLKKIDLENPKMVFKRVFTFNKNLKYDIYFKKKINWNKLV